MRCERIIKQLCELAPEEWACSWDNPGLLAGRLDKEVGCIYIALDAADETVEAAIQAGADMLLTHHPLIFKAIKKVNDQDFITRRLVRMIQADISYYAMHTNFDGAPGCMADLAAARIGIEGGVPLEVTGERDGTPFGIGKMGTLREPQTVGELARRVKEEFGLPFALAYGLKEVPGKVTRAAVCPGSGGSEIENAIALGAQVLITGDISHHQAIDAAARGLAVIDGGHYGLEHIFVDFMEGFLRERLGPDIRLIKAEPQWPAAAF